MALQGTDAEDEQRSPDAGAITATHYTLVGSDCTAEGEGTRIPVLSLHGHSIGHECISESKDDAVARVPENPTGRFHAFRHFNVAILDALRAPLKTIQERIGHAVTGSFTLDVYGGQPEWERNLEAAQLVGAELEKAVIKAEMKLKDERKTALIDGLTPIQRDKLPSAKMEALEIQ